MKAQGLSRMMLCRGFLIFFSFRLCAEGISQPAAAPKGEIPVLSGEFKDGVLTLSWPKAAVNWALSQKPVDGKNWKLIFSDAYLTNESSIYVTNTAPANTTLYRLVKVPPGFNRRHAQAAPPPPPPTPAKVNRPRPAAASPPPPN